MTVDIRLVAATNEDLPGLARVGKFREDLLDRLAFDVITLPPLRERQEDIPVLAEHFAIHMSQELGHEVFPGFTARAMQSLVEYPWPGNIRELRNVVERAVYQNPSPGKPVAEPVFDPFTSPWRPVPRQAQSQTGTGNSPATFKDQVRDFEIAALRRALSENRHNQRQTAERLGLSYDQLRGLLRKYSLT